jgi:hypothetical protein
VRSWYGRQTSSAPYRLKLARKQVFCACETGDPNEDGQFSEKSCIGQMKRKLTSHFLQQV